MKTLLAAHMSRGNILAHEGFSPENCQTECASVCGGSDCASTPMPPQSRSRASGALSYQFDDLIYRMVDKHGWPESKARAVFEETKQFLVDAAVSRVPMAPTKDVDEVWHNFILYTPEYAAFCEKHFGKFIHHVPKRRGEVFGGNCQSGDCDARSCITPAG